MIGKYSLFKILSLMVQMACISLVVTACYTVTGGEKHFEGEQISGISFVAANEKITVEDLIPIKDIGATWVSLMPYGFVREAENAIHFNTEWQYWGEKDKGLVETAELARMEGMKVMIKPHVWFRHGEYTGDYIPPDSVKGEFKKSFSDFVLHYAEVARRVDADLYCIGTEWHKFIDYDPGFWQDLIKKTKKIYTGPITYAANWDEYKTVPFWQEMDFIGVNAYFPLSDKDFPSQADLQEGWQSWIKDMQAISISIGKPILFTEYGYRSTVGNTSKPWESSTRPEVSLSNQTVAYNALYNEFWYKPWFSGGFAWKWFHNHAERGGDTNIDYTPQNKPVEEVIRDVYSNPE